MLNLFQQLLMNKKGFTYIMGNNRPTLYVGATSDLRRRVWEHKRGKLRGFTQKYKITKLLYFEYYENIKDAIKREKQLKNWHREWKLNLIKSKNPSLKDLDPEINSG